MASTVSIQEIFSHVLEMPSISRVVQELMQQLDDPRANNDDIAKTLAHDPVLSAKVLRLANSAKYGSGRKVASIDAALFMLGLETVRTLVVASGMTSAFQKVPKLDMHQVWRESFLVASICRAIARHAKLEPETAFTAGLMHRLGVPLLYLADPTTMDRISHLVEEGAHQEDLERNQFGFDHGEVGEELARRWNFPETIRLAVGQHTRVQAEPEPEPYAVVIALARYLVVAHETGLSRHDLLDQFPAHLANHLHMDALALLEEVEGLMAEEDDIEAILS